MRARLSLFDSPLQPGDLRSDVVAGLTTAIMLIPQGMAYALLAGLDPIIGLYASTLPVAVYALLGSSRQLAVGPVAMVSLLVASGVGAIAGDDAGAFLALAAVLALMIGVVQWGMGAARLGALVRFLSHPVVSGFTAAAALIIGLSQLGNLLGVSLQRSHHVHEILLQAAQHASSADPTTVAISLLSVATLVVLKRHAPRAPRFLLVVVGGSLAVWGLSLESAGVAIVGDVPGGLPMPKVPDASLSDVVALLPIAITISLVSFMESISVARSFARTGGYQVDADRELKALGLANVAAGFFQGYPVTGGFSRTAVNAQAGARSRLAGLITAAVVAVTLLFLTPLLYFLPRAALSAIILTAVLGLVDVKEARHLWHVSRPDLAMMGLTFGATLTLGIEQGILAGVLASLAWFVWNSSAPYVAVLGRLPGTNTWRSLDRNPAAVPTPGMVILRIDGPLFFASTAHLLSVVADSVSADTERLVLEMSGVGRVDAQGLSVIERLRDRMTGQGGTLVLVGARGPIRDALQAAHLDDCLGSLEVVTSETPPPLRRVVNR